MIVSRVNVDVDENVYKVASKIVGVRVQNVVDPEIVALLDDCNLSWFGSEGFVVQANLGEGGEDDTMNDKFSVVVEDDDRTGECLLINNKPSGDHIF